MDKEGQEEEEGQRKKAGGPPGGMGEGVGHVSFLRLHGKGDVAENKEAPHTQKLDAGATAASTRAYGPRGNDPTLGKNGTSRLIPPCPSGRPSFGCGSESVQDSGGATPPEDVPKAMAAPSPGRRGNPDFCLGRRVPENGASEGT